MDFIHFVGNSYYSKKDFVKEANKYGITRKIPFQSFKSMNLGDRVFLTQGGKNGSKVFGYFTIDKITLENKDLIKKMCDNDLLYMDESFGGHVNVDRGCGSYCVTGAYIMADPGRVMSYLKLLEKDEVGNVMIGGQFHALDTVGINKEEIATNIPFKMGIRPFDFAGFKKATVSQIQANKKRIRTVGMFYAKVNELGKNADGAILEISDYHKK